MVVVSPSEEEPDGVVVSEGVDCVRCCDAGCDGVAAAGPVVVVEALPTATEGGTVAVADELVVTARARKAIATTEAPMPTNHNGMRLMNEPEDVTTPSCLMNHPSWVSVLVVPSLEATGWSKVE